MPPKRIGHIFKTSLSLDAKDYNGSRGLCPAYRGPLFIHVDEIMVDQEVVHLVDPFWPSSGSIEFSWPLLAFSAFKVLVGGFFNVFFCSWHNFYHSSW